MLPAPFAPPRSGLEAPEFVRPAWVSLVAEDDSDILDHARRAHEQADERARVAEQKGSRLATLSMALMGVGLTLSGYHLNRILESGIEVLGLLGLIPAGLSVFFLALAGIDAFEVDRVGLYGHPGAEEAAREVVPLPKLVEIEECGRQRAAWTAKNKLNTLLQARAWFSRGTVALLLAAVVWIWLLAIGKV
jgi:hypothetical protein